MPIVRKGTFMATPDFTPISLQKDAGIPGSCSFLTTDRDMTQWLNSFIFRTDLFCTALF